MLSHACWHCIGWLFGIGSPHRHSIVPTEPRWRARRRAMVLLAAVVFVANYSTSHLHRRTSRVNDTGKHCCMHTLVLLSITHIFEQLCLRARPARSCLAAGGGEINAHVPRLGRQADVMTSVDRVADRARTVADCHLARCHSHGPLYFVYQPHATIGRQAGRVYAQAH